MGKVSALLGLVTLIAPLALADNDHFMLPIEGSMPEPNASSSRRVVGMEQKRSRVDPTGEARAIWWNGAQGTYRFQKENGKVSMIVTNRGRTSKLFEAGERAQTLAQAQAICAKRGARLIDATRAFETCTYAAEVLGTGADEWLWVNAMPYAQGVQGYNGSSRCYFGRRHAFSAQAEGYKGGIGVRDFSNSYVRAKFAALDPKVDSMTNRRNFKDLSLLSEGSQFGALVLCVR